MASDGIFAQAYSFPKQLSNPCPPTHPRAPRTYRGKFAQLPDARLYLLQNTIDSRFHHGCLLDASGAGKTGHEQWRARARRWPIQRWPSNVAESLDHGPAHDPSHPLRLNICEKWHLLCACKFALWRSGIFETWCVHARIPPSGLAIRRLAQRTPMTWFQVFDRLRCYKQFQMSQNHTTVVRL